MKLEPDSSGSFNLGINTSNTLTFSADKAYDAIYLIYYEIQFTPAYSWRNRIESTAVHQHAIDILDRLQRTEQNPSPSGRGLIRNIRLVTYKP